MKTIIYVTKVVFDQVALTFYENPVRREILKWRRFADEAARDAYLPHPDHKALGQGLLRPIAEDVLVFDYEF